MTEPEIIKKPKRLRRICWYSLAVVVLCVVGLLAYGSWRAEKQQAAIAVIERLGGTVEFEPGGPDWLRRWVGDERMKGFDRVGVVFRSEVSDRDLKPLSDISKLKALKFWQITDKGLRHLRGLTDLESLALNNTQITDKGLRHLRGLTNLEKLGLINTQITDKGLRHLIGMRNLKHVWLDDTHFKSHEGVLALEKALPFCRLYTPTRRPFPGSP